MNSLSEVKAGDTVYVAYSYDWNTKSRLVKEKVDRVTKTLIIIGKSRHNRNHCSLRPINDETTAEYVKSNLELMRFKLTRKLDNFDFSDTSLTDLQEIAKILKCN